MLVFTIDDEEATLQELRDAVAQAEPGAEIRCFRRAADALDAVALGERPDVDGRPQPCRAPQAGGKRRQGHLRHRL